MDADRQDWSEATELVGAEAGSPLDPSEEGSADRVMSPAMDNPPFDRSWDCAFVDAPWGPTFGRHQSTHAATLAVKPGGLIAIHDCEREREQTVCRVLLEGRGYNLLEEVERLRIYQAPR